MYLVVSFDVRRFPRCKSLKIPKLIQNFVKLTLKRGSLVPKFEVLKARLVGFKSRSLGVSLL